MNKFLLFLFSAFAGTVVSFSPVSAAGNCGDGNAGQCISGSFGMCPSGHDRVWGGADCGSGLYCCDIKAGNSTSGSATDKADATNASEKVLGELSKDLNEAIGNIEEALLGEAEAEGYDLKMLRKETDKVAQAGQSVYERAEVEIAGLRRQGVSDFSKVSGDMKTLLGLLTAWKGKDRLPLSADGYDRLLKGNKLAKVVDSNLTSKSSLFSFFGEEAGVLNTINTVIGVVAIIWFVVLGAKFVFAQGEEEKLSQYKKEFGWIVLGLAFVSVAEYAGTQIFDPTKDIFEGDESLTNFEAKALQIKAYIQYLVGGIALVAGVRSGYNLITNGEEDEAITKEKAFVKNFLFVVFLMLMPEVIVNSIIFKNQETVDASWGVTEMVGIVNFSLSFLAGAAALMIILAAMYYVSSFGDEDRMERAKKLIISSIVAFVIVYSSFTLISFLT